MTWDNAFGEDAFGEDDLISPELSDRAPPPGDPILPTQVLGFRVGDDVGLDDVTIEVRQDDTEGWRTVYQEGAFSVGYDERSSVVENEDGSLSFQLAPNATWAGTFVDIRATATDTDGNELIL